MLHLEFLGTRAFQFLVIQKAAFSSRIVSEALPQLWLRALNDLLGSTLRFSSTSVLNVLHTFADEYQPAKHAQRKEMINNTAFIKLLSECVRDIEQFTNSELSDLLYVLTERIGWRDLTLLKLAEPTICRHLPAMSSDDIVKVVRAFGAMKCGSRAFWESIVASIVSGIEMGIFTPEQRISITRCILQSGTSFYKPTQVLRALVPNMAHHICDMGSIADVSVLAIVVSSKISSVSSKSEMRAFMDLLLHQSVRLIKGIDLELESHPISDQNQLEHLCQIFKASVALGCNEGNSLEFDAFRIALLNHVVKVTAPLDSVSDALSRTLVNAYCVCVHEMYKSLIRQVARTDSTELQEFKSFFVSAEHVLTAHVSKIPPGRMASISQVYAKLFGLVNSYKYCPINFGPNDNGDRGGGKANQVPLLTVLAPHCVRVMPRVTLRDLARLGEAFAMTRQGSDEFWASYMTCIEEQLKDDNSSAASSNSEYTEVCSLSSLSPEEIEQLVLTLAEANVVAPSTLIEQLMLAVFEKIHLMENSINYLVFFFNNFFGGQQRDQLVAKVLELSSNESLESEGSVVLTNLVLRNCANELRNSVAFSPDVDIDTIAFQYNCKSVLSKECLTDLIDRILGGITGSSSSRRERNIQFDVIIDKCVLVDLVDRDRKTMYLIHPPSQVHSNGRLTGTGLLRSETARAIVSMEPFSEYDVKDVLWTGDIVDDAHFVGSSYGDVPPTVNDETEQVNWSDHLNLSPYVRNDRSAAHRKRAPPAAELPWVSKVLSLKRRGGRRKSGRKQQ